MNIVDEDHISDESDIATRNEMVIAEVALANIQLRAAEIPVGKPGDCDMCGEWAGRLVGGACAPCRDRYKLP